MLEKEFKYFKTHQDELVKKYDGRVLVIIGDKVVGNYDTETEAYYDAASKYELGTFLIQQCVAGEKAYTQTFYTLRAIF